MMWKGFGFYPPFELYLAFVQTQGRVLVPVMEEAQGTGFHRFARCVYGQGTSPFSLVMSESGG